MESKYNYIKREEKIEVGILQIPQENVYEIIGVNTVEQLKYLETLLVKNTIEKILQENASAPLWGLAGEPLVNVLEVNLAINKQYG